LYPSDNAGIGYASDGSFYPAFTAAYERYGRYDTLGVTWDPPGGGGVCWWVHVWGAGGTQDFIGPNRGQGDGGSRALMQEYGWSTAYRVSGGIWQRYKQLQWRGYPWLGYPWTDEYLSGGMLWQNFRCGVIGYNPSTGSTTNTPNTDVVRRDNGSIAGAWASNPKQDNLGNDCDSDDDNDWMLDSGTHPVTGVPGENVGCGSGPTNPLVADTDGDTVMDGAECALGSNPNDPASMPAFPSPDNDLDRLPAWLDNLLCPSDVDGDGHWGDNDADCDNGNVIEFSDGVEFKKHGTAPGIADTDGDSCDDWIEIVDFDGNRVAGLNDVYIVAGYAFPSRPANTLELKMVDLDANLYLNVGDVYAAALNSSLARGSAATCGPGG
jgi:hypothetical protein